MDTPVGVVRCILTTLFLLVALHALLHGIRQAGMGRRNRVDHLLHAVMAVAMSAMPWNLHRWLSGPTMAVLFTAAALWFPLTALHRRTGHAVAAIAGWLPLAVGMAAMAWMPRMPDGRMVLPPDALAGSVPVTHHAAAVAHAAAAPATADAITVLLTLYLLVYAMRWLNPLPPPWSAADTAHRAAATDGPYGHLRDGAMALGTAVMLLMPH
ncbi:conserved membrane hypothetical protein [Actinacidiphila cocklensis]|uniref:DUF5134 domain-containing protein n=1 Tax=Actinacidiphila cocklensis TaxID=887465 RepID=A0A9W4DLA3_9ACTN|nr:conserved membrane hypothetical protein [Actinacidiphila cocklensis]